MDKVEKVVSETNQNFKRKEGWYYKRPSNNVIINGVMKVFTGYDAANLKVDKDHLKSILDFVLTSQSSIGGCNIYDYVYVLTNCMELNYRTENAKKELEKQFKIILEYQQSDGGFSYDKNRSQTNYYGVTVTPGMKNGDLHGTTLFLMALSRIDKYLKLDLGLELAFS